MRVALLTPAPPFPPRQGAAVRNDALLRALAAGGHEVWLFTLAENLDPRLRALCAETRLAPPPSRRSTRRRILAAVAGSVPDVVQRYYQPALAAMLGEAMVAQRFDAVQIEGLEMAAHWLVAARRVAVRPWAVYDAHNAEHVLQERAAVVERGYPLRWAAAMYSYLEARKLRRYERVVRLACDLTLAVSEPDRAALARLAPGRTEVLPNGVNTAGYELAHLRPAADVAAGPRLLFTGTLDYRPNVDAARWFVAEIWPGIKAQHAGARLCIVGARPAAAVRSLGRRPGVFVFGDVPDIRDHLAQADVFVVPLRFGAGSRVKVLEAFAAGLPVVSTLLGCEGLAVRDGRHVLLAEDAAGFVAAMRQLVLHARLREALSRAGRQLVEERYDWTTITPRLLKLYGQRTAAAVGR